MNRSISSTDKLISKVDLILKAVSGGRRPDRVSPAARLPHDDLTSTEAGLSARLMRVNHCGEVCAQALYLGQSVTSNQSRTRDVMRSAAIDEADHLAWCETRIAELESRRSYLDPFFFAMSFTAGAVSGLLGDKFNLGFVAATEEQVVKHLAEHIEKLPETDHRSRAILEQMKEDEEHHRTTALKRGGLDLPGPFKRLMTQVSNVMTRTTYWI